MPSLSVGARQRDISGPEDTSVRPPRGEREHPGGGEVEGRREGVAGERQAPALLLGLERRRDARPGGGAGAERAA